MLVYLKKKSQMPGKSKFTSELGLHSSPKCFGDIMDKRKMVGKYYIVILLEMLRVAVRSCSQLGIRATVT